MKKETKIQLIVIVVLVIILSVLCVITIKKIDEKNKVNWNSKDRIEGKFYKENESKTENETTTNKIDVEEKDWLMEVKNEKKNIAYYISYYNCYRKFYNR